MTFVGAQHAAKEMVNRMLAKYYRMFFLEDPKFGVAWTDSPTDIVLPYLGQVESWIPPVLQLRDGEYPDYLSSSLACRLCSERLMNILQGCASENDNLQWLKVLVRRNGQEQVYHVLHFPSPPEVLNKQKTIFAGEDFVVKPVLCATAARDHQVFTYPKNEGLPLFVSQTVKNKIELAGCTGIEFSRLRII
jgi:hypothetical protein